MSVHGLGLYRRSRQTGDRPPNDRASALLSNLSPGDRVTVGPVVLWVPRSPHTDLALGALGVRILKDKLA
jgi:hypothetical protein